METLQTYEDHNKVTTYETKIERPTEKYIHWLRTEFGANHWEANPDEPCLLYKVYKDTTRVPLDGNIPLQLGKEYTQKGEHLPAIQQATPEQKLSWLLYYTHGLTRVLRPVAGKATSLGGKDKRDNLSRPKHIVGPTAHFSPTLGRPVPSGGSLHPVEMYLALDEQWNFPAGIYHYDSAHHSLDLLRTGNFMHEATASLPATSLNPSVILFLGVCIQKNHQKYAQFSYLLQTLDTGIALEQLHFVAERLGLASEIHRCFIDRPIHTLLGLDTQAELIYAALPMQISHSNMQEKQIQRPFADETILKPQPAESSSLSTSHIQPFTPHTPEPLLQELYAASIAETNPTPVPAPTNLVNATTGDTIELKLPAVASAQKQDLAQILLRRHTSSQSIDTREISIKQLATILQPLQQIDDPLWSLFDCQVYCAASRVSSLPVDTYRYCRERHTLIPLNTSALIPLLMRISTGSYIQSQLPPLNLFFCGNYQKACTHYGERGLRMLGIEIGRMLQCISLQAAIYDLGTHVHVNRTIEAIRKRLLHISDEDNLPLASMLVGHKKNAEENLFETVWY